MLVWLAEHLVKYYSGFNVFSYLTFRAIVSLLTALFISLWMGPRMIRPSAKTLFRPGCTQRRSGIALQQARYADHGRDHDPDRDCGVRAAVGRIRLTLRLVRADRSGWLRDHRFC